MKIYCILSLMLIAQFAKAQATCEVSSENLKGTYTGECKKGKANGTGKATGIDRYEGEFKNGYPDGKGVYTFHNNSFYSGNFKKGLRSGAGEFHAVMASGEDSVLIGFWDKDQYLGEYEKPYIIHMKSTSVIRVLIHERKGIQGQIVVESKPEIWGDKPSGLSYVGVAKGNFTRETKSVNERVAVSTLYGVEFPFRAMLKFGNNELEVEFFQNAGWEISVEITGQN